MALPPSLPSPLRPRSAPAPPSLAGLIAELERLPGVGHRTAERLAHHLLRVPEERALALADAIRAARRTIRPCSSCRAPSERDPCPLCADSARDDTLIMVIESPRDVGALEAAGRYRGLYYVLGRRLSPLDGVGADDLDLAPLLDRVRTGAVREVCLATNADLEGDGTAALLAGRLADAVRTRTGEGGAPVRITRLARGLPAGGQIEYQSAAVLADAFDERRVVL